MKKIFFIIYPLLILSACFFRQPEKEDIRFINESSAKARAENKLLIISFLSANDDAAKRLNEDIFMNKNNSDFIRNNFLYVNVDDSESIYKALATHFKPEGKSTVVYLDQNGNEIDRTIGYDGNMNTYLDFMNDVSEGKNLYSVVYSAYLKDSLNVRNNYQLARKLTFRNRYEDAVRLYENVLLYDSGNSYGYNSECILRVTTSQGFPGNNINMGSF